MPTGICSKKQLFNIRSSFCGVLYRYISKISITDKDAVVKNSKLTYKITVIIAESYDL